MLEEVVLGSIDGYPSLFKSSLPPYADPLTKAYGQDLFRRMMKDPVIAGEVDTRCLAVLADGINLMPAVDVPVSANPDPKVVRDADQSKMLLDFTKRCFALLDDSEASLNDVARDLLDGLPYGHKIAEKVLQWGSGEDAGKLVLKAIKPRDSRLVNFIVDEHANVLGFMAAKKDNQGSMPLGYTSMSLERLRNDPSFAERSRFAVFRNRGENADPRGMSILCPAYNAWYIKTQLWPEFYKYLKQFGTPIIVGKTPDAAPDQFKYDDEGNLVAINDQPVTVSPQVALFNKLLGLLNASVVVVPFGTEVDLKQSEGDGQAFLNANDYFDRQMVIAISGTSRQSLEAKHGSKADTGTAQDVAGLRIANDKIRLAGVINRDIIRPLIRDNFGSAAVRLAPVAALSATEQQDLADMWRAVASLETSGALDDTMRPQVYLKAGLPAPDLEARQVEREERKQLEVLRAGNMGKLMDPSIDEEAA